MDQLQSEILLTIFKNLSSLDMVPVRAVCRKFLEIIDQNKSLWRHLNLPDSNFGGWDPKILNVWDEKSASSLEEVSMKVRFEEDGIDPFIKTLERSKETLQVCSISASRVIPSFDWDRFDDSDLWSSLAQLALVLPKVVDFRVMHPDSIHSVRLVEKIQEQKNPGLKVLWLRAGLRTILKMTESQLLNRLVSLKLNLGTGDFLREVLEASSQTLKHLSFDLPEEKKVPEVLESPLLECLQVEQGFSFPHDDPSFPSWMRVPLTTIVISGCMTELPSVLRLWLRHDLSYPSDLGFRAPRLEELRISTERFREEASFDKLHSLLHQRKKNVERLLEVDSVRMIPLKRLGIWFELFSSDQIDELRDLVEEVFDLESVSTVVEIEI